MIKRYGPHFLWLLVCIITWCVARNVDSPAESGAEVKAAKGVGILARDVRKGKTTEPPKNGKGGPVASSSLAADFDFPPEWDAKQCVRESLGELNEYRRMQKFQRAMQRLTKESAATMQEVFSEFDKKGRWYIPEYGFFLRHWAEIDGKGAADFVVGRADNDAAGWKGYVKRTMAGWVINDPEGAEKWINAKEGLHPWVVDSSVQGMIEGLAEQDAGRAMAFALSQAEESGRDGYFSTLTESLIYGAGMQTAEEWLAKIPAEGAMGEAKRRVFGQIVDRQLRGGTDGAAALALTYANEPWVDMGSVMRIAKSLSRDEAKFTAWVNALPEGRVRTAVTASVDTKK